MKTTKTYRKPKSQKIYEKEMKKMGKDPVCRMCSKVILSRRKHGDFVISKNDFKYDRISDINDMVILKEHKNKLTQKQILALFSLFDKLDKKGYYNHTMFNFSKRASIAQHWHWHLFKFDR